MNPERPERAPELLAEARRHDPERTLCLLFAPAERRGELAALVLLNHELARVAEIVRQPLAGMIRLRFWRDQLALAASGGQPDLPIARALAPALRDGRLTLGELEALIEARERELDGLLDPGADPTGPPPSIETVEAWLRATSGGLARAIGRLLEAPEAELAAAVEAGTAHGLVGVVRATLAEAGRPRRLATRSLVDIADLRPGQPLDEAGRGRLRGLAEQLLARAAVSIAAARRAGRSVDRARLAPLLLATVAETHLRRLRRLGGDPLRVTENARAPLLPLRLLLAWVRGRP